MKIDAKTLAELKKLATILPKMQELDAQGNQKFRFGTFKETGKALLEANPKMKDEKGRPLQPNKFYKVKLPVWINHEKEILKAYQLKGPEGVDAYCTSMAEAHKKWKQNQINPIKKVGKFLRKVKAAIAENN